jgi:hypothetical protein
VAGNEPPVLLSRLPSASVKLGLPLSQGAFGDVFWATMGDTRCIAKRAVRNKPNANEYLQVEAQLNAQVCDVAPGSRHLAPFVGVWSCAGVEHLVWEACPGTIHNLKWYLEPKPRLVDLAKDLGVIERGHQGRAGVEGLTEAEEAALAQTMLREMMRALALLRAAGVAHRDVKPENWLVDSHTRSLRIIDLGSACELREGGERLGYSASAAPGSEIYSPPERLLDTSSPWSFDVFSAALVWLRTLVPAFASKRHLDNFRLAVRSERHSLDAWLEHSLSSFADESGHKHTQPGWAETGSEGEDMWARPFAFFKRGEQGRLAWRLLRSMMHSDPSQRVTAAEALAGPYLGGCHGGLGDQPLDDEVGNDASSCMLDHSCPVEFDWQLEVEECALAHEEEELITVQLPREHGLILKESSDADGHRVIEVDGLVEGGAAHASGEVHAGDLLLAAGPLDISERSVDDVTALLSSWRTESISMRLCSTCRGSS